MTIIIDHREPENLKAWALKTLTPEPAIAHLDYGDFSIIGNGPSGSIVVGIERKTISDFYSSFTSGRLMNRQVPGMVNSYEVRYLILEGSYSADSNGYLTINMNRGARVVYTMRFNTFNAILHSLQVIAGFILYQSKDIQGTLEVVQTVANWWARPWKDHNACKAALPGLGGVYSSIIRWPIVTKMIAQIEGVGLTKAHEAAKVFDTPRSMVEATRKEWLLIPGIGVKLADRIMEELGTRCS